MKRVIQHDRACLHLSAWHKMMPRIQSFRCRMHFIKMTYDHDETKEARLPAFIGRSQDDDDDCNYCPLSIYSRFELRVI